MINCPAKTACCFYLIFIQKKALQKKLQGLDYMLRLD